MTPFTFQRGEPITVDLVIDDAGTIDPSACTVTMKLKLAQGNGPPPKSRAAAATFSVAYTAAVGAEKGYWRGTISAATSAGLAPGMYITDAMISLSGSAIEVTGQQLIRIQESVTPA